MTKPTLCGRRFPGDGDGAMVTEYALLISMVTVVFVLVLSEVVGAGVQADIAMLAARLVNCFAPAATTC